MSDIEDDILNRIYQEASSASAIKISSDIKGHLEIMLENRESRKGVLAMTITLALKKIVTPEQDIRIHQDKLENGFSARVFDNKFVTPFLKKNGFPYMKSGSGALTRSLEESVPFNLQYSGSITPIELKTSFLLVVDAIQDEKCNPEFILHYIFNKLIKYRDRDESMKLTRPVGKSISEVVGKIEQHFSQSKSKASQLPVLAIYAVYQQLVREVQKYEKCKLLDLKPHEASDSRTGLLGDIQVNDSEDKPFEAIEIKHKIKLDSKLIESCYDKFKVTNVKTYYLLSTEDEIVDKNAVNEIILRIQNTHGCQVIVNGIQATLKYYLRLLRTTDDFISAYVSLIEKECDYETKLKWDNLWK